MRSPGFTLIELLVSVAIAMLISGSVVIGFNNFSATQRLKQAGLDLKNNLRLAQIKAQTGQKPTTGTTECDSLLGYRISFTTASYTIQARCVVGGSEQGVGEILSFSLPSGITFRAVPAPVTFLVLSAGAALNLNNPVILGLTNVNQDKSYQLRLDTNGKIDDLGLIIEQ